MEEPKPRIYAGIKWGLQAPTVLLAARYTPAPRDHIQIIREVYVREMMLEEAAKIARQWQDEFIVRKFYCDPSQERFITIMRKQRLWAVSVEAKEVNLAINLTKKRLANFSSGKPHSLSFDLVPGRHPQVPAPGDFVCPNLMADFLKFRGKEQKANQRFDDRPLEVDNYALSALHYILLGLATEVTPRVRWL